MASAEKTQITSQVSSVSEHDDTNGKDGSAKLQASNWHPGYRARFPWMGFVGLVGVLVCAMINVAVLIGSNGVSESVWPHEVAPHTVVNTIQAVSNLFLALAIAEGVSIAWWRKALKGATVAELHQSWSFSMSFTEILKHFWRLDVIALATLATKMAIVDSFLFQNAATTYVAQDPATNVTLLGVAATQFPQTGYVVTEGFAAQTQCNCFMIGDQFTPTVNTWETSNGYFKDTVQLFHGCDGICYSHVDAIGFEIECQKTTNHSNYAEGAIASFHAQNGTGDASKWTDLPIFNSSFAMAYPDAGKNYSRLMINLVYFDSDDPYNSNSASCPGVLTTVECSMRPALVRYPTTIVNYTNVHITNGISIGGRPRDNSNTNAPPSPDYSYSNRQAEGFEVLSYLATDDQNVLNSTTQLGGIANALSQYLSSTATITYTGNSWALAQRGTLAQTMMFGPPNMGSCDCSFRDALSTLVESVNQLTFLAATNQTIPAPNFPTAGTQATVIGISDNTTAAYANLPNSMEISDKIHYRTLYMYLGLAVGSTVLCLLLIVPAFWRYGELGRHVTLGPMEIASAFRAPMLETGGDGKEAVHNLDDLIERVGHRKVQYGVVDETSGHEGHEDAATEGASSVPGSTPASPNPSKRQSVRLGIGEPGRVRPVSGVWSPPSSPRVPTSPRVMSPSSVEEV